MEKTRKGRTLEEVEKRKKTGKDRGERNKRGQS